MQAPRRTPGEGALATAIETARATVATRPGSLWVELVKCLCADEHSVASALQQWQGVMVLDERAMRALRPLSMVETRNASGWVAAELGDQVVVLAADPWEAAALAALGRMRSPGAALALAKPGQLEQARLMSPMGPRGAAAAGASPVVEFVDAALLKACEERASDVHFEVHRSGLRVQYRIDGVMVPGGALDTTLMPEEVLSRIKVMAQLDITEQRRPQDGRVHWRHPLGTSVDLRVSVMPSIFGEDAVLRLLDKAQLRLDSGPLSLDALGFDGPAASRIRALARRPHGMLLVTGPTGSGKTTTLYAALTEVNDGLEKVVTIEDPVEYELAGVLQIPVNEKKGLTFATGLRSILRHDPDKILVGEIRDAETAEIAVQSALTGHTVFTTVHANSVLDVLGRFQHFGIDPFSLASAINGVVVQRLLRRVCTACVAFRGLAADERRRWEACTPSVPERVRVATGCPACRGTGYRGRFVLAETHQISDPLRDMMVRRRSVSELKELIYSEPGSQLLAIALGKVVQGITTLEEVTRVVGLE